MEKMGQPCTNMENPRICLENFSKNYHSAHKPKSISSQKELTQRDLEHKLKKYIYIEQDKSREQ